MARKVFEMAKFRPGPTIAQISGSIGGTTYSRNRYGMYARNRVAPVMPSSEYITNAKARFETASMAWQALTAGQKLAWKAYAEQNPVIDSLGQSQILSPHVAYISLNSRMLLMGNSQISAPPITATPNPLSSLSLTADIGLGGVAMAFATSPLGAAEKLFISACVKDSAGINYVKNSLRYCGVSSAAETTPFDCKSLIEGRVGTLVVGQILHVSVAVIDNLSGQLSQPLIDSATVVST